MKAIPLPYQLESIKAINRFKGCALLAHEMGLGKTLISLWWWEKTPQVHPGLVVCPASMKFVWEHEALQNLGVRPYVAEGQKVRPPEQNNMKPKLVIVNYDILHHWLPWLQKFRFNSLFVDECQYVKNGAAKRTKAVRKLARGIPNVVAISGTPLLSRPIELFSTLQMLLPNIFRSRWAYAHEYCKPRYTPWGWNYDGASHLPELHSLLKHLCMIRCLKADVLPELPEKIRRVLPLTLSDEDEYREATDRFLQWLGKTDPAKLLRAKRAEALVKLGCLKRLAARLKLRSVIDWVNRWLESYPDEKIVLFAVHRKMIEALERRTKAKSVIIDGSVTGRKRKAAVDQFQQDGKTRVLIGNIQAAGVGITLTAASTLVFCELDWVPSNHVQGEDRIHRIGQTKQSWIWYLVAAGTIEEDLCEILERKQRVVQTVLDGTEGVDDLDVHRQLLSRMSQPKR